MKLRIATRKSELALVQARSVADRIEAALSVETELVPLQTSGDRLQEIRLAEAGGKGLFIKEIEEALLAGRADVAVHSAKDLPGQLAPGLVLAAFPERADPRDALVCRVRGGSLDGLAEGARVGTGSLRRTAQLRALRPDLEVVPLRGNVPTRLRKLDEERLDAVVLACAGLERLGLAGRIDERLETERLLPAPAQGILAVQSRADDGLAKELAAIGLPPSERAARAERAFLARIGGDCHAPVAALAEDDLGGLRLRGLVASLDGVRLARAEVAGGADPEQAGAALGEAVLADGGDAILAALREAGT
jgi:hydroxymethylbilane synthase